MQGWFAGFGVTGFGVLVLGCRDFGLGFGMAWGFRVCCLGLGGFGVWGLRIWVEVGGCRKVQPPKLDCSSNSLTSLHTSLYGLS